MTTNNNTSTIEELHNKTIKDAWSDFKGGYKKISNGKRAVDVVQTARTGSVRGDDGEIYRNCITVYLKSTTEIPQVIREIAEVYDLTHVKTKYKYESDEIESVSYADF